MNFSKLFRQSFGKKRRAHEALTDAIVQIASEAGSFSVADFEHVAFGILAPADVAGDDQHGALAFMPKGTGDDLDIDRSAVAAREFDLDRRGLVAQ